MSQGRRLYAREWREARSISAAELAERTALPLAQIEAIETGASDFTGAMLEAFAEALECEPWSLLIGPPAPANDPDQFRTRLIAQMLRDVCVEAVTTFDDMGRLDDLKKNTDAEEFWNSIAALFESTAASICRRS